MLTEVLAFLQSLYEMGSTTLATLSLTLQPEKGSLKDHELLNTNGILRGEFKIDNVAQQKNPNKKPTSGQTAILGTNHQEDGDDKEHQTNGEEVAKQRDGHLSKLSESLDNGVVKKDEIVDDKIKTGTDGNTNNQELKDDKFQRLPKPQQDILLLHGPGQRYSLEKARDIPELKSDQELLIQV